MESKFKFISYETIDSTNDECKRLALFNNDSQNYVIIADSQSNGRGAKGNFWHSPSGNLHMSMLIRDFKVDDSNLDKFILNTSECVRDTILSLKHVDAKTKAPNDVLIDDKKVAGILVEQIHINNQSAVIIGIGVNTSHTPTDDTINATSLKQHGIEIPANKFAHKLTDAINNII